MQVDAIGRGVRYASCNGMYLQMDGKDNSKTLDKPGLLCYTDNASRAVTLA